MNIISNPKYIQIIVAAVATLFGMVTIFAGTRVFLGTDPGYQVFQPLLIYNISMGFVYIFAGISAWDSLNKGKTVATLILALNLIVLAIIASLSLFTDLVATESLGAITFRSIVWLVLLLLLKSGVKGLEQR